MNVKEIKLIYIAICPYPRSELYIEKIYHILSKNNEITIYMQMIRRKTTQTLK